MSTTPARKRATLKIVLAGVAIVGVGAAVTTAVWTDDVFFGATATASTFDLQHSASATGPWSDAGVPGNEAVVTITATGLDTLSPTTTVDVPFYLCNVGNVDGIVADITDPVIVWPEAEFPVGTLTVTATVTTPLVDDALDSDPTCASPVVGTLVVATTADFPPAAQGTSGTITFTVTGESS